MGDALSMPNRGVRNAPFAALQGAAAPAVQVECGFLTNAQDAGMLGDPRFHDDVARAVARGIEGFRNAITGGGVR
jgi:N-acetylmuramoyl-L-alanine amidase